MAVPLKTMLKSIRQKLQNWKSYLISSNKTTRLNFLKYSVFSFASFILLLFIVDLIPLPIQQPFEASLDMKSVSFNYPSDQPDNRQLIGTVSNISCLRLSGVKNWSINGKVSQSSNPKLIGKDVPKFQLPESDSLIFIGSCQQSNVDKLSLMQIQEIRIPSGTKIEYFDYLQEGNSMRLGMKIPKGKQASIKLNLGSKSVNVTLQNAKLASGSLLDILDLSIQDISLNSQTFDLKSSDSNDVSSIRVDFQNDRNSIPDWIPSNLVVDDFRFRRCDIPKEIQDKSCKTLVRRGSIRFGGNNFATIGNGDSEKALDANSEIKINGGKIEFLRSLKVEKDGLQTYLTGRSVSVNVDSQASPSITLFKVLPDRFVNIIISALVSCTFSLLVWLIQKWLE